MTCYDLALPSDPIESDVIVSCGKFYMVEYLDRYLCYEGDREVHDYSNEYSARAWLDSVVNSNDNDEEM